MSTATKPAAHTLPQITAVHCYGNNRDIRCHPSEARHSLAVEIDGVDHCIDIADIPLKLTSAMDDGPVVALNEAQTLAIGDEIARRCNSHAELVEALVKMNSWVATFAPLSVLNGSGPCASDIKEARTVLARATKGQP